MNDLWFLIPFALLALLLVPTFVELFRRKDKGPREVSNVTIYGDKTEIALARDMAGSTSNAINNVEKDVSILNGTELEGDLVVPGNLSVGKECHVHGTLKSFGDMEIGEFSTIDGNLLSTGTISVRQGCKVRGVIVSTHDILLGDNVVAEAVTTEKSVILGAGVQINKRISGTVVVCHETPVWDKMEKEERGVADSWEKEKYPSLSSS